MSLTVKAVLKLADVLVLGSVWAVLFAFQGLMKAVEAVIRLILWGYYSCVKS